MLVLVILEDWDTGLVRSLVLRWLDFFGRGDVDSKWFC